MESRDVQKAIEEPGGPTTTRRRGRGLLAGGVVAACLCAAGSAAALDIDVGNPDIRLRWDNTLRYNAGVRAQSPDPAISRSTSFDESDGRFGRGDVVTNRLDLLSEADVVFPQGFGFRASGAAWFDGAYGNTVRTADGVIPTGMTGAGLPYSSVGSYSGNEYSDTTKKYYGGPYGELLDAFAFATFSLGEVPVSVKVGRHSIYWGDSLFTPIHGVSYSQQPSDLRKAQATPGSEAKELFLPLTQISGNVQLTESISVGGQYYLEWAPFRVPEGGTYLAGSDIALEGPDRTLAGVVSGNPLFMNRIESVEAPQWGSGDWGANVRYRSDALGTLGLYFRRFDEKMFWLLRGTPPAPALSYRAVYPQNTMLYGVSLARSLGSASMGAEVVYRVRTALATQGFAATNEGARGNTVHGLVNFVNTIGKTPVFSSASWLAEVVYSTYTKVSEHPELFNAGGYAPCARRRVSDGCATKDFFSATVGFTPSWFQVFPGADLSLPLTFGMGLHGNSAVLAGGNERAGSYSAGLGLDYRQKYRFDLKYVGYLATYNLNSTTGVVATSNGSQIQDRGWVAFTFKLTL